MKVSQQTLLKQLMVACRYPILLEAVAQGMMSTSSEQNLASIKIDVSKELNCLSLEFKSSENSFVISFCLIKNLFFHAHKNLQYATTNYSTITIQQGSINLRNKPVDIHIYLKIYFKNDARLSILG